MVGEIERRFARIEDVMALQAIRQGLVLTIPVLLIGSFCLIFLNFPFPAYQDALSNLAGLKSALTMVYNATMGIFSLYVAVSIGLCYARAYAERYTDFFMQGAAFTALAAYLILMGFGMDVIEMKVLSTRSLFIAIVSGLASSALYCRIVVRMHTRKRYSDSIDGVFNQAIIALLPMAVVLAPFALANATAVAFFDVGSVEELFYKGVSALFPLADATFGSGLVYLLMNNVMWFFGIHGGNMLDGVAQSIFVPGTAANAAALAAGGEPVQIVTKTFLDVFASIGGAGALLSLLVAILLFGRLRTARRLSLFAAIPMTFNISEIMMFGLPVVWNPLLLVPFILVPLVNMTIAYGAMSVGLVPPTIVDVSWITPPIVGGYVATGSISGALLQLINIAVGVVIYLPFLRRYERAADERVRREYESVLDFFKTAEQDQHEVQLLSAPGMLGVVARSLAEDVRSAVEKRSFMLYYQPQFDSAGRAVGAEALLRFDHPMYGMVYPPLVIHLAEEAGFIEDLERTMFNRALDDAARIEARAHEGLISPDFSVSVNATVRMLQNESDVEFIVAAVRARNLDEGRVVVEATEREALRGDDETSGLLRRIVEAGIPLAIDGFSMGRTSFQYLETSVFSIVKLDGAIAKGVMENERYAEIVASITRLSDQLGFSVLAEYVETVEQRDRLLELGCSLFQGYLYAPALPFDQMIERVCQDGNPAVR